MTKNDKVAKDRGYLTINLIASMLGLDKATAQERLKLAKVKPIGKVRALGAKGSMAYIYSKDTPDRIKDTVILF